MIKGGIHMFHHHVRWLASHFEAEMCSMKRWSPAISTNILTATYNEIFNLGHMSCINTFMTVNQYYEDM